MKRTLLIAALLSLSVAHAEPLVYQPINPTFGGSPLNGPYLLSNASAQNKFEGPEVKKARQEAKIRANSLTNSGTASSGSDSLDRFSSLLESRLLSSVLDNAANGTPGRMETNDFVVNITDTSGTLNVDVMDKATGETSHIQVDGLTD